MDVLTAARMAGRAEQILQEHRPVGRLCSCWRDLPCDVEQQVEAKRNHFQLIATTGPTMQLRQLSSFDGPVPHGQPPGRHRTTELMEAPMSTGF